jgi:diguanylate cyclase (GGDEF)-like protein/PAS domain S-box-containing protein
MTGRGSHRPEPSRRRFVRRDTAGARAARVEAPADDADTGMRRSPARGQDIGRRARAPCRGEELRALRCAAHDSAESIFITDACGRIAYVNPAFTALTGYTAAEAIGRDPAFLGGGDRSTASSRRLWEAIARGEVFVGTFANRKKNGERYFEEKSIRPVVDTSGRITHFVSTGRDVTGRMLEIERLRHLADRDPLTGLPNRRRFSELLREHLCRPRNDAHVVLLYVDVDDFKSINDRFGHAAGDAMLGVVARRLVEAVGRTGAVGRLSGDEFAAILPDMPTRPSVTEILEQLVGSFAVPVAFGDDLVPLSVSVGVHPCPPGVDDPSTLLHQADRAMYVAKRAGGLRYAYHTGTR